MLYGNYNCILASFCSSKTTVSPVCKRLASGIFFRCERMGNIVPTRYILIHHLPYLINFNNHFPLNFLLTRIDLYLPHLKICFTLKYLYCLVYKCPLRLMEFSFLFLKLKRSFGHNLFELWKPSSGRYKAVIPVLC